MYISFRINGFRASIKLVKFLLSYFSLTTICDRCNSIITLRFPNNQRWSPRGRPWPRGHILKSLASRPQVLKNWPFLGSRASLFFGMLKFCGALEKFFGKRFLVEIV